MTGGAYVGTKTVVIDDFNDNSLSTTIWTNETGADVTETSAQLHILDRLIASGGATPGVTSKAHFDATTHVLAFKWRLGDGTHTPTTTFNFELDDSSDFSKGVGCHMFLGGASGSGKTGDASQFYTPGSTMNVSDPGGATTGMGSDLADNTWVGMGMIGSDNKVGIYTSTDNGATWSLFRQMQLTGTIFNKSSVVIWLTNYHTTTTDNAGWHVNLDEVSQFSLQKKPMVRVGGAWVAATPKVRVGGAWVVSKARRQVGGAWV